MLSPNTFEDKISWFGLSFSSENGEKKNFLTANEPDREVYKEGSVGLSKSHPDDPSFLLPTAEFVMTLSGTRHNFVRQRYTLSKLLGDVGGFNRGLVASLSVLLRFYSARIFTRSITHDMPVKNKKTIRGRRRRENLASEYLIE